MRALPILAALICATPLAKASTSELELLQSRCQEQERQIRQLEEENSRLKSLVSTASKTPAPVHAEAPAKTESKDAKKEEAAPKATAPAKTSEGTGSYAIVRNGDTLNKVAQRNRTSPEALAEANDLKKPFTIRAGQRLLLPEKPAPVKENAPVAKASAPNEKTEKTAKSTVRSGTHKVKDGETFYSISRHYGMSTASLQAANPGIKAGSLHTGQTLRLGAKPAAEESSKPAPASFKPAASLAKSSEPTAVASKSSSKQRETAKVTELSKPAASSPMTTESKPAATPAPAPAPAAHEGALASAPAPTPAAAPAAAKEKEQPAADGARVRTVAIEETTPLTSFAAAHGTSIARLNALNGLNLNSSTVLAKGSELYVPAQP